MRTITPMEKDDSFYAEIKHEVASFLHPYLSGEMVEENSGEKCLMTILLEKFGKNVDLREIQNIALKEYVKISFSGFIAYEYKSALILHEQSSGAPIQANVGDIINSKKNINIFKKALKKGIEQNFPHLKNEDIKKLTKEFVNEEIESHKALHAGTALP